MLGYVTLEDGAVRRNLARGADRACDMLPRILGADRVIGITRDPGTCAQGCRLDTGAPAQAVALAGDVPVRGADPVIVSRFGQQECLGNGFHAVIAGALARGVPVLTPVARGQLAGFRDFAADPAQPVAPGAALDGCRGHLRPPA